MPPDAAPLNGSLQPTFVDRDIPDRFQGECAVGEAGPARRLGGRVGDQGQRDQRRKQPRFTFGLKVPGSS